MSRGPFDLSELPVEPAAHSLQKLALWAVDWALQGDGTPIPQTELAFWVHQSSRKAQRWNCPPGRRWWFRSKRQRIAHWSHGQFHKALHSTEATLPDSLYSLAATMAWTDPGFELEVWASVRHWLFGELIFGEDLEQHLGFSAMTLWAVLTMACDHHEDQSRKRWWHAGRTRNRRLRRVVKEFDAIAGARFRRSSKWAGFWDQWLLGQALHRSQPLAKKWSRTPWGRELATLPWVRFRHGDDPYGEDAQRSRSSSPAYARAGKQVYESDWSNQAPPRLLAHYGYPYQPPPLPGQTG